MDQRTVIKWEQKDIRILKNLYGTVSVAKLAKQLNRTETAIYAKAIYLGLKRERIKKERLVQCFVTVKRKNRYKAFSLIHKTIKKWK